MCETPTQRCSVWAHVAGQPGVGARAAGARWMPGAIGHGRLAIHRLMHGLVMIDACRPNTTASPRSAATVNRCSFPQVQTQRASEIRGLRQVSSLNGLASKGCML